MSFRDKLEECASEPHLRQEEVRAFKTAIAFLDLMAEHENEILPYPILENEWKFFKRASSSKEPEIRELEKYLTTLSSSIPRYWAVKLQTIWLGHADKYEMVRKQHDSLEEISKLLSLEVAYDGILDKWSKNWKPIVKTRFDYERALKRPEDTMFTERLKGFYENRRVSTFHQDKDGSNFKFGDIDLEEVECTATSRWGSEICRQAFHIVPSRTSTAEMNLMFVTTEALNPALGAYDLKNGSIF
ncbi:uncharacterized protein EAF01_010108 [Botrytis porri]|uniref:uncharacterized protein n=1 Tax=Botrytis porri TaxID=87229 RepID=UPI0019006F2D|nr:uncharacterized protein EAF01_010108 [Botrytis porri]KAF7894658.1 hypothetical protein EAF01_010108 [Botrytis porri]